MKQVTIDCWTVNKFDYFTSNQQFCLLPIGRISLEFASYLLIQGLQEMWAPCCNRSQIHVKWSCWMTTCITAACDAWLAQDTSGGLGLWFMQPQYFFPPCLKRILEMNDSFPRYHEVTWFWWSSLVFECLTLRNTLKFSCFSLLSQGKQWYHLCREHHCSYHQLFLQALGTNAPVQPTWRSGKSLEDYPTKTIKTHECNRSEIEAKEGHMGGGSGAISPNG